MIDSHTHSFINSDGNPYYDNILTSQKDRHVYRLKMVENVEYRISASQPNTTINQINLALVNIKNDTLAISLHEPASKSAIVLRSPETANYYLIVNLEPRPYPSFSYRLNFEQMYENVIPFSGFNWFCDGAWEVNNSNEAVLKNVDSRIIRHLKLNSNVSENPDVTFIIKSNSTNNPNFGILVGGSGGLMQFGEYAYELTNYGHAFLTFTDDMKCTIIRLRSNSMSFDWWSVSGNLDFNSGITIELKYNVNSNLYSIYLNNNYLDDIHETIHLKDFYVLIQDCGEGTTLIKDFILTNR
jgi:hypothetical protein